MYMYMYIWAFLWGGGSKPPKPWIYVPSPVIGLELFFGES